jgi:2-phospho-L-lactate guanylyltransferase
MPRVLLNAAMQWSVIVPVKALANAKTRLDEAADVRADLSRAFLVDVLSALTGAAQVHEVIVVCDSDASDLVAGGRVRLHRMRSLGLNEDLLEGLALVDTGPVAIVAADLPCLTSSTVDAVLTAAATHPRMFLTDAQGLGTTMLLDHTAQASTPTFGPRSHARHVQAGYREIDAGDVSDPFLLVRARRDVDTAVDLWDAQRIGVGPATQSLLDGARA